MREDYTEKRYERDRDFVESVDIIAGDDGEILNQEVISPHAHIERVGLLKNHGVQSLRGNGDERISLDELESFPHDKKGFWRVAQAFVNMYNQAKKDVEEYEVESAQERAQDAADEKTANKIYPDLKPILDKIGSVKLKLKEAQDSPLFAKPGIREQHDNLESQITNILDSCSEGAREKVINRIWPPSLSTYVSEIYKN